VHDVGGEFGDVDFVIDETPGDFQQICYEVVQRYWADLNLKWGYFIGVDDRHTGCIGHPIDSLQRGFIDNGVLHLGLV
jgi:hypothetical protein